MLYNPKWNETPAEKENWNSLDNLISWLESKDPNEYYDYYSSTDCMLAQYFKDQGYKKVSVGCATVNFSRHPILKYIPFLNMLTLVYRELPLWFDTIANQNSTFGGALVYAKQIKAGHNTYEPAR